MADRAAARLAIDLGFAAAVVACGVVTYVLSRTPSVPDDVCATTAGAPRYAELFADHRLTIAAVFGELRGGPGDRNAWSAHALTEGLRARGFAETAPDHFELGDVAVDISLLPDDAAQLGAALTSALSDHDFIYYNGHNEAGRLAIAGPDAYRIIVMDTCFSTQLYSAALFGEHRDVIGNRERSVTGSVESLLVLVDGLRERADWAPLLGELNRHAHSRARVRAPISKFKAAEDYRLDTRCRLRP